MKNLTVEILSSFGVFTEHHPLDTASRTSAHGKVVHLCPLLNHVNFPLCVCVHVCGVCTCAHSRGQGLTSTISLCFCALCFEIRSLTESEAHCLG